MISANPTLEDTSSFELTSPKNSKLRGFKSIDQTVVVLSGLLPTRKDGLPTFADSHIKCSHKRLWEKGGKGRDSGSPLVWEMGIFDVKTSCYLLG